MCDDTTGDRGELLASITTVLLRQPRAETLQVAAHEVPHQAHPYLYNIDVDGLRVLLTLHTRNMIIELVDAITTFATRAVPQILVPPQALVQRMAALEEAEEAEAAAAAAAASAAAAEASTVPPRVTATSTPGATRPLSQQSTVATPGPVDAGDGGARTRSVNGEATAAPPREGLQASPPAMHSGGVGGVDAATSPEAPPKQPKHWFHLFCIRVEQPQVRARCLLLPSSTIVQHPTPSAC